MTEFHAGETVTISVEYRLDGTLTDPDTYTVSVWDKTGQLVVTNQNMTKDSTGKFSYDYTISSSPTYGVYTAQPTLTKSSNVRKPTCNFEVIET